MGYAATASQSASRIAWAIASHPVISSSCSSSFSSGLTAETAILLHPLGDREAVLLEQLPVPIRVRLRHLVQAVVVVELQLVDHLDTVLDWADLLTDRAADACLVDHLIGPVRRDLEALVGAVQPAQGALDALVEVNQRAPRARGPLLVDRIAGPDLHRLDDDPLAHLGPAGLLVLLVEVRVALAALDRQDPQVVVGVAGLLDAVLVFGLLADVLLDRVDRHDLGRDPGHRGHAAIVGVVVVVDPQARQAGRAVGREDALPLGAWDDRQGPVVALLVGELEQLFRRAVRRDQQETALADQLVDRLNAVPGPRLDALAHHVVDADRHIHDRRLVLGEALLELVAIAGDDREVLGGHTVALGRVAVSREGRPNPAVLAGRDHQPAADSVRQGLLEDASVDDLYRG